MSAAYGRICERCGLEYRAVEADSGQIGGKVSTEYMALAEAGEAGLVFCPSCDYAADDEAAACVCKPVQHTATELQKIETPGVDTIASLAEFLGIGEDACVKALVGKNDAGEVLALFVPGDHELNDLKAEKALGGFRLLDDEELKDTTLPKGSIGPVGLPAGIKVVADENLRDIEYWVVGANEAGYHYVGAGQSRDFQVDTWADLCVAEAGDACPECGTVLEGARGIEVSQVFQLGDKYSKAMGAVFADEEGNDRNFIMGCYGVGVSRTLAAVVEQHNDENGIIWPLSVAPAQVCVIPLSVGDDTVYPVAERIAASLATQGIEVAMDDRDERAGVKFADADLIGWPMQIVVGKRGVAEGTVELKRRSDGEKRSVSFDAAIDALSFIKRTRPLSGR